MHGRAAHSALPDEFFKINEFMPFENKPSDRDSVEFAKSCVRTGPRPDWVEECPYDSNFNNENENHTTSLLYDRQIHAERNEDYVHEARRLETMEAVQHLSQWRFQFEPQTQSVVFHFIKVKRSEEIIEQLNLEKGHLFQREEGLNRFVIDGWFTYLQVLEDVRPGDILEWAYTVQTNNRALSANASFFQCLPEWISVGKYQFVVRFKTGREMKWKSSSADLNPLWSTADGLSIWTWYTKNYIGLKQELNTPSWYVSAPWIQISDCPDWQTVATDVANAWAKQNFDSAELEKFSNGLKQAEPMLEAQIARTIQLIQDDFRYLSVNLEFGGQIPNSPDAVARRRYGDCKDLSFLLATLLRQLGIQARPVLVNAQLRKTIGDMLPSLNVFNHVIVEFEVEDKKRWIDPTIARQGGGAFGRVVPNYGLGLPVGGTVTGLTKQPEVFGQSNLYELREVVQLDTTGAKSLVSLVTRAEGIHADRLRDEFAKIGAVEMAKSNLQACANRYGRANRVGELKCRDDRATNQFYVAEVFEIDKFLMPHPNRNCCQFAIPSHWIKATLALPEATKRRTPFALPYPCQIVHHIEIASPTVKPNSARNIEPRLALQKNYAQFSRTRKTGYGFWIMELSISILADSVPPAQLDQHREFVESVWNASLWNLVVPIGYAKPKQKRDFGELPPASKQGFTPVQPKSSELSKPKTPVQARVEIQAKPVKENARENIQVELALSSPDKRRHDSHQKHRPPQNSHSKRLRFFIFTIGILVSFLVLLLWLAWCRKNS